MAYYAASIQLRKRAEWRVMDWKSGLCIVLFSGLVFGCGPSDTDKGAGSGQNLVQAPSAPEKVTGKVIVRAFKGGYGIDFYQQAAKEFEAKNPGVQMDVDGSPDVAD